MNLSKLFEMQRELDERIVKEKGLEGRDLLPEKILALQVELGELANEWRGFKFWKVDPQPSDKVLEEYVDCLHFILSIGIEFGVHKKFGPFEWAFSKYPIWSRTWLELLEQVGKLWHTDRHDEYWFTFYLFKQLGYSLGFNWEQIEAAYVAKNAINHDRQASGY